MLPGLAHAQPTTGPAPVFGQQIFTPFAVMTQGTDAQMFSAAALLIAGLPGHRMLLNCNIPFPVLALTGGLVLFLIALQAVLRQFDPPCPP